MLNPHLIAKTRPAANAANIVRFRDVRITVLSPRLFRIEQSPEQAFCDEATQTVWFRDAAPVAFRAREERDACVIATDALQLTVRPDLAQSFVTFPDGRQVPLSNEGNLLGTYRTLDCCDGDFYFYSLSKPEEGHPVDLEQGVVSRTGVAVHDDSAALILRQDGTVALRPQPETDWYVFAFDHDYRAAVQALYSLCGPTPMLPRFSLGNWWSRYWSYTQDEYLALMDSFADRDIPFTVATVDMDWHPSANLPDGEDGWTGYTWNKELFPDYRAFLRDLHERGLRVTLNLHPALGVRWFEEQYPEMARRMGIDPASKKPIPFNIADEDFINAYFDVLHKPFERDGVDFWWIDWQQGSETELPGLDPLWSLNHYHTLDIAQEKEPLILSRYAGIGSHRYPLGFSGDTRVTWATMRYLPYFTSTATNAGYSWWSHDIGGHMNGIKDDELFVRFIQFGVFSPINRLHSTKTPTFSKDIVAYRNGTGLVAGEFLRLRHAMIPFLYSAACDTAEQGLALIEPMYYAWPDEADAYACPGQYLFGQQLIAAPITEKSTQGGWVTKRVWLPEGTWTDVFTGDVYRGGAWREMTRSLESFPLLAGEGTFFVMDGQPDGNSVALPSVLRALVFAGSGSYQLKEDGAGSRAVTTFRSEQLSADEQRVTISCDDPDGIVPRRALRLEFRNVQSGKATITRDGQPVAFRVRQEQDYTLVTIPDFVPGAAYTVTIREQADGTQKRSAAIVRVVTEMEGDNIAREKLCDALCKVRDRAAFDIAVKIFTPNPVQAQRLRELEDACFPV